MISRKTLVLLVLALLLEQARAAEGAAQLRVASVRELSLPSNDAVVQAVVREREARAARRRCATAAVRMTRRISTN